MKSMMKCNDVREYLLDLAEGQNGVPADVREHLKACSTCAQELQSLKATMAVLDEWKTPEPSPYFDSRLQARLREERSKAAEPSGLLAWMGVRWQQAGAVALAAVMAVAIGFYVNQPKNGGVGTPQSAAVSDLQELDQNADLYTYFDLLDDAVAQN
ncbi:MAG: hypothetical protein L0Z53_12255 [Acidobacteriales bacterium]|nr:hypothetical protein [Terriglobales bacterium]